MQLSERYCKQTEAKVYACSADAAGDLCIYPFASEAALKEETNKWSMNWVAWKLEGRREIGSGGIGVHEDAVRQGGLSFLGQLPSN